MCSARESHDTRTSRFFLSLTRQGKAACPVQGQEWLKLLQFRDRLNRSRISSRAISQREGKRSTRAATGPEDISATQNPYNRRRSCGWSVPSAVHPAAGLRTGAMTDACAAHAQLQHILFPFSRRECLLSFSHSCLPGSSILGQISKGPNAGLFTFAHVGRLFAFRGIALRAEC